MTLFAEETFGPVVSIYRVGSDDEAVERANDDPLRAQRQRVEPVRPDGAGTWRPACGAGTVNVNEAYAAAWGSIDAPMGGMGDSGMGRRHGVARPASSTPSPRPSPASACSTWPRPRSSWATTGSPR